MRRRPCGARPDASSGGASSCATSITCADSRGSSASRLPVTAARPIRSTAGRAAARSTCKRLTATRYSSSRSATRSSKALAITRRQPPDLDTRRGGCHGRRVSRILVAGRLSAYCRDRGACAVADEGGNMKRLLQVLLVAATVVAQPLVAQNNEDAAVATFAGGCFWCVEEAFDKVEGVLSTTSGYIGGRVPNPKYEQVSRGTAGQAEAVQVEYDREVVTYAALLEVFWHNIDPLDAGGQFCDRGDQYRSAIFYHDEHQRELAELSKQELEKSGVLPGKIVTEIV